MTKYKDRDLLKFKGLTWRYSKRHGHWTPVEKEENLLGFEMPTVWSSSDSDWFIDHVHGTTPLETLERWAADCIQFDEREAADFRKRLYESEQALVKLHAESWKLRGTKKKAKTASKKKGKRK
jgi:hypothetical protein